MLPLLQEDCLTYFNILWGCDMAQEQFGLHMLQSTAVNFINNIVSEGRHLTSPHADDTAHREK